ncbi:desi1 [Symbiodinium natans]|uniref:Desi1 protein n=1 Tax=Symbiodinium natans TaxID=878477 RepID=A0A812UQZ4_9DINO|nr:desi1 [Symbiodinium natans]
MGNAGGILSCCVNDHKVETKLTAVAPQRKLRPLLCDLEAQFAQYAGSDKQLDEQELTDIWIKASREKFGDLTPEDEAIIRQSTKEYFKVMDIDKSGKVTYEEFVAAMLGGHEDASHLTQLRKELNAKMKNDPAHLQRLVNQFHQWDKNGDGYITKDELQEHLVQLQEMAMTDGKVDKSEKRSIDEARKMMEEVFAEADVDMDGRVDLWEVMAYMLGRKKQSVELLLYDISKGMAAKLGPLLLGKSAEAVHTGVLVYGSEYWYGGKVFRSNPPCRKQFGEPLKNPWGIQLEQSEAMPELPVVRLGYTFVTHEEFLQWLRAGVQERYTGLHTYDLLSHSCNHFSNEVCTFLLGQGIPEKIFELQKTFLSGPIVALRPFLNRYLGGFAHHDKDLDENLMSKVQGDEIEGGQVESIKDELLGAGDVVLVEGIDSIHGAVLATILKEENGKCEIKYFDPTENRIETMPNVPLSKCKKTTS